MYRTVLSLLITSAAVGQGLSVLIMTARCLHYNRPKGNNFAPSSSLPSSQDELLRSLEIGWLQSGEWFLQICLGLEHITNASGCTQATQIKIGLCLLEDSMDRGDNNTCPLECSTLRRWRCEWIISHPPPPPTCHGLIRQLWACSLPWQRGFAAVIN